MFALYVRSALLRFLLSQDAELVLALWAENDAGVIFLSVACAGSFWGCLFTQPEP